MSVKCDCSEIRGADVVEQSALDILRECKSNEYIMVTTIDYVALHGPTEHPSPLYIQASH